MPSIPRWTVARRPGPASAYLRQLRLFRRDVRLYLSGAALLAFASDGIRMVVFNLYLLRLGYGPESVGLINAAGAFVYGLLSLPAGALGRRHTSRRAIVVGVSLMAVGYSLLPVVEAMPPTWRTTWLMLCTVVGSAGVALFFVNNMPFLASITGPEERYHAFAVEMALVPLAGFSGALLGGALPRLSALLFGLPGDGPEAFRLPLILSGVLLLPSALVMSATSRTEVPHSGRRSTRVGRPPVGLILGLVVVAILRFASRGAAGTFFNVYMDTRLGATTVLIGAVTAVAQLFSVPAALVTPLLTARWGNRRTVTVGLLASAAAMVPLALVPSQSAAAAGYIGSSALFFLTTAPMRVWTQEIVSPAWGSAMSGALVTGVGLSAGGMALGGGYAITAFGFQSVFLVGAALTVGGALLFEVLFRETKGRDGARPRGSV